MAISRVIEVSFRGSSVALVRVDTAYFYNNGIIFKPTDIDLPTTYQVHWADSPQASSTLETIGTAEGAPIPDDLWNRSRVIYGWIYLHPTQNSGVTGYEVRIYKNVRAGLPDGTEPTPAEQSTIDQLITALNTAVEDAQDAQQAIEDMSVSAQTLAEGSTATVTKSEQDGVVHLAFGIPRGATGATGATGASGQDGSDGVGIASTVLNADYTLTITLTDGTSYTTPSIRGASGADGADGSDGNGIASVALNADYTLTLTFTDGTSYTTTSIRGAQGETGQTGATGATPNLTMGTVTTLEPDSQATATITGTAENPVLNLGIPQGDAGEVTLADLNDALMDKAPIITDTASGSIASFTDGADNLPLKSLVVDINPIQDLSNGDPSPENICPISGWTQVNVNHSDADMTNPTTITIALGQTVYGGKLDVLSGVLTVDRAMVDLGTLTWAYGNVGYFLGNITGMKKLVNWRIVSHIMSDRYATTYPDNVATAAHANNVISTNPDGSRILIADSRYTDAPSFKSAMDGVMVCYELAEPIEIQLTPNQINSLYGVNNIWADSGDTEVEYRANTKLFIERLTAPDSADMVADANITSGKYFMVGNNLFKATANIANGSAIIVGTNAVRKSLSEALNEINA